MSGNINQYKTIAMNHSFDRSDIIQYLSGEMPKEQIAAFERTLAHDEQLSQQLAFYQNIDTHIEEVRQDELKSTIDEASKNLEWESLEEIKSGAKQEKFASAPSLVSSKTVLLGSLLLLGLLALGFVWVYV